MIVTPYSIVMLNLFQDPILEIELKPNGEEWMLKQVQHDGVSR